MTQSTFVAIASLLVFIRVYVRTVVVKRFGLDDAVIVLALVSTHRYPLAEIIPS